MDEGLGNVVPTSRIVDSGWELEGKEEPEGTADSWGLLHCVRGGLEVRLDWQ